MDTFSSYVVLCRQKPFKDLRLSEIYGKFCMYKIWGSKFLLRRGGGGFNPLQMEICYETNNGMVKTGIDET
jgi:hypothetical protein